MPLLKSILPRLSSTLATGILDSSPAIGYDTGTMMPKRLFTADVLLSLAGHIAALMCMGHYGSITPPGGELVFDVELGDFESIPALSDAAVPPDAPPVKPSDREEQQAPAKKPKEGAGASRPQASEDTVNLDSRNSRYTPYLSSIRDKIESRWKYPYQAYVHRESGTAVLTFSINARGDVANPMVAVSSGSRTLDEESIRTVRGASPYPPLPRQFNLAKLNIIAQFRYRLPE